MEDTKYEIYNPHRTGKTTQLNLFQIIIVGLLGLFAGVMSGMLGIGGGTVIVPGMQYLAKFPMKEAIGTSLAALLVPCTLPAVLSYYRAGQINVLGAGIIAAGLLTGAFYGSRLTLELPDIAVKRAFGILLLAIAIRYLTARS